MHNTNIGYVNPHFKQKYVFSNVFMFSDIDRLLVELIARGQQNTTSAHDGGNNAQGHCSDCLG